MYKDMVAHALHGKERPVLRSEILAQFEPKKKTYVLRAIGSLVSDGTILENGDGFMLNWDHINRHIIQHVRANRATMAPGTP